MEAPNYAPEMDLDGSSKWQVAESKNIRWSMEVEEGTNKKFLAMDKMASWKMVASSQNRKEVSLV